MGNETVKSKSTLASKINRASRFLSSVGLTRVYDTKPAGGKRVEANTTLGDIDKSAIVREVVADIDNEYGPTQSFDSALASQAASLAVDKLVERLQIPEE